MSDANELPQLPWAIQWASGGLVRHVATLASGSLATFGAISPNQQTSEASWIASVIFGILALAWSALNHKAQNAKVVTAARTGQLP